MSVRSLASFLPPHLVRSLAARGGFRLPRVERFPAALLVSDISGFTALTELLQARGREGAEDIAAAVNGAFAPAIRAIESKGGSIVSFGGDALFAVFPGRSRVRRALMAAEAIQEAFARRPEVATSAGPVRLAISQAVHHGIVLGIHLGSPDRRHYLLAGPTVAALARLEAMVKPGTIVVSPSAKARRNVERASLGASTEARGTTALVRRYLEPQLVPLLGSFVGEYRRMAALFIETGGARPDLLQSFFLALAAALDRTEGVLLKTDLSAEGAKWLCVLGIPRAHEDDPDRSARLALDALRGAPGLRVRAGLHAGTVANIIIGTRSRRSFDVMGDVVNTAARAMVQASWGEVLVTGETRKLLSGADTEPRGARAVKGKAAPLELYCLKGIRAIVKQIRVSAPMIGRDAELSKIVDALERAREGRGSVIGIKGEAGMGKSRLKYEASKAARQMGVEVHEGRAISFGGMAYWTIGALLRDVLGLPELPEKAEVMAKVAAAAGRLGMKAVDRHHLAEVLGARYPDSPIEHLKPQDIRLNAMIAIRTFCQAIAKDRPRLLVLEDMHWADGASVEAAQSLAKAAKSSRFVELLLYRPGYEPPAGASEIPLSELGGAAVDALLGAHLGVVSDSVVELVRERAGGNPFYVEEVVRHLLETGILGLSDEGYQLRRKVGTEDLPATVEAVIAARLDCLSVSARKVAQCGAVIGRSFLFPLLAHFDELSGVVADGVAELVAKEILFENVGRGLVPRLGEREYIFKHALTRDVAYESILSARRRKLHASVAAAIEELFGDDREAFLPMLGHHREQALQYEEARACYLAGARASVKRFVHAEAAKLFRSYLALVEEESVESIEARKELGEDLQLQGRTRQSKAEYLLALRAARAQRNRGLEAATLLALGILDRQQGRMEESRAHYEQALAIHREVEDRRNEGIMLGNLGNLHREQGRMVEAHAHLEQALAIHRAVANRRSEGQVLGNLGVLHHEQGWMDEASAQYERALAIHREVGDRRNEGIMLGNLGNLHLEQGRVREAEARYEQALAIHREVGDRRSEGIVLGNLGILHFDQGRVEEARAHFEQALAVCRDLGDRPSEGHVLGNLGILHFDRGRMDEARAQYEQALAIHREVGDRRFESIVLGSLAAYDVLVAENADRAARLAREGEATVRAVGDLGELCNLLAIQGHIALASGGSAELLLVEARKIAVELGVRPESEIGRGIARLDRAQYASHEAGHALVCGHCPEDLTVGQLRWLRAHRPEAIPPEVMARLDEDGTLRLESDRAPASSPPE